MSFDLSRRGAFPKATHLALALSFIAAPQVVFAQGKATPPAQGKGTSQAQAAPVAPASPMEKIPKVVAVVNGQTITRDKLAQESMRRFGPVVLDNLLNKYLILQACKAQGINITQADVNNEIARTSNKFGLSTKLFLEAMEKNETLHRSNTRAKSSGLCWLFALWLRTRSRSRRKRSTRSCKPSTVQKFKFA